MFRLNMLSFPLLVASVGLGGCWNSEKPYNYSSSSEMSEKLLSFAKVGPQGASLTLSDYTTFPWQMVFFFEDGTLNKDINKVLGIDLFKDSKSRYIERGPLLVFVNKGGVAEAFSLSPPLYISGTSRRGYSREEAKLIAHTKDPGPYGFRFAD